MHRSDDTLPCIFCSFAHGVETARNAQTDMVYEDSETIAFISPKRWPNNPGNALVIPRRHFETMYDIPEGVLASVLNTSKRVARAMKSAYACDGITLRQNNEIAGGQEIFHFHIHVFPRWADDALYANEENTRYVSAEERSPYAKKLRAHLLS